MSDFCSIQKAVPVSNFTQSCLTECEISENDPKNEVTIGGILSNCKYAWYANGPRFHVIALKTGRTIAAWTFGSLVKDPTTKVTCVTEIPAERREIPILVIGLECVLTGGMICVFDLSTSKVLRAIQLKDKVTSVHVIDSGSSLLPVHGPLRSFDGVIGVGSLGGNVLLIDLCRHLIDEGEIKDEVEACQVIPIAFKDLSNVEYQKHTLQSGKHLAIYLNVDTSSKSPHFALKGPEGDTRIHVNKLEVAVSSLCYCPQLGSLLVGFNFGAWQIWELFNLSLVYTSPVYEENTPISHFAFQEPMDDPKPFFYVWTVYSNTEPYQAGFPIAVMYSLSYDVKEYHDGYGYVYQDFQSCSVRFQTELASMTHDHQFRGASCIRLTSYNKNPNGGNHMEHHDDSFTIASLAWNVWGPDNVETYLSVFDLNQWYKAQMPSSPDTRCDSYISFIRVTDLMTDNQMSLDVAVDESTVRQFLGVQKPEEHYYPTALSYDFMGCSDKVINFFHYQGHQRSFLINLKNTESLIMLKPADACRRAVDLGLTPLFLDANVNTLASQREFLFNLALENQMTGWLCNCVTVWSNGSFVSTGCSLESFLEWAWGRACVLKSNADSLCIPLFDCSETILDSNSQKLLSVCLGQLTNLLTIYNYINKKLMNFIQCKEIIQQQLNSLQIAVTYLDITQWLVNTGLLPESNQSNLYPIQAMLTYYEERRAALQAAFKERFSSNEPVLFIDNLLANEFSDTALQNYWKLDDGNGLYPPSSMQSLLRTYLIDDVSFLHKHSVVIYAFLDLAMALDKNRFTFIITQLVKFPTIFHVSPSTIKITEAFWHLDHGDYGPALERLLDPQITNADLKLWHHRIVLNSFLIQGQFNSALTYYQIRKPCLKEEHDIKNIVSLYIENKMLRESLTYIRNLSNSNNREKLLMHFYSECNSTKQIKQLIRVSLNHDEELVLMKYLKDIEYPDKDEYEIIYYLQRFRYMDIFKMCERSDKNLPSGLVGQKNLNVKEGIVRTLNSFFPKVSQDLYKICQSQKDTITHKVFSRPTPMSVFVHNSEEQTKYKSSLILAGLLKAKETWTHPVLEDNSSIEEMPFVRTPVASRANTRKRSAVVCEIVKRADDCHVDTASGESPCKRRRLSARESLGFTPREKSCADSTMNASSRMMKFDTPIVKRRRSLFREGPSAETRTPQSILKIRNSVQPIASGVTNPNEENMLSSTSNVHKLSFGLTPRKSLQRSTVHFEGGSNVPSSNETSQLSGFFNISSISQTSHADHNNVNDDALTVSDVGKDRSGDSSEDVYYSPDASLSDHRRSSSSFEKEKSRLTRTSDIMSPSFQENKDDASVASPESMSSSFAVKGRDGLTPVKNRLAERDDDENNLSVKSEEVLHVSVKERSFVSSTKVGTLAESTEEDEKKAQRWDSNVTVRGRSSYKEPSPPSKDLSNCATSPVNVSPAKNVKEKLRGRKSLSRMVLENNAFAAASPRTRSSIGKTATTPKVVSPSPQKTTSLFSAKYDTSKEGDVGKNEYEKMEQVTDETSTPSKEVSVLKSIKEPSSPALPSRRSSIRISGRKSTLEIPTKLLPHTESSSTPSTSQSKLFETTKTSFYHSDNGEKLESTWSCSMTSIQSNSMDSMLTASMYTYDVSNKEIKISDDGGTLQKIDKDIEAKNCTEIGEEINVERLTNQRNNDLKNQSSISQSEKEKSGTGSAEIDEEINVERSTNETSLTTSVVQSEKGEESHISWGNTTTSMANYTTESSFSESMFTYDIISTNEAKQCNDDENNMEKIEENVELNRSREQEKEDEINVEELVEEGITKTLDNKNVREEGTLAKMDEEPYEEEESVKDNVVFTVVAEIATEDEDVVHIDDSKEYVEMVCDGGDILDLTKNEFEVNISTYSSANQSTTEGPITKEMLAQSLLELNIPNPTLDYILPDVSMETEESAAEREARDLNVAFLTNYSSLEQSKSNSVSPRQPQSATNQEDHHSARFDETINLNTAVADWKSDIIEISDSSDNSVSSKRSSSVESHSEESEESTEEENGEPGMRSPDTRDNSTECEQASDEEMEEDVCVVEEGNELNIEETGSKGSEEENLEEYAKQILDEELEDQDSSDGCRIVEKEEENVSLKETSSNSNRAEDYEESPEEITMKEENMSQNIVTEQEETDAMKLETMSCDSNIPNQTEELAHGNDTPKEQCEEEPATNLEETATNLEEPATNLEEPAMELEEPAMNLEETGTNLEETAKNLKEPAINLEETAKNLEETATNLEETAKNLKEPAMNLEETAKNLEETATNLEKTASNLEETGTNLEETAMNLEETAKNLKEPAMNLEETAKNLEETATNLEKTASNLEETGTNLEETAMNLEETATNLEETGTNLEETATNLKEPATNLEETAKNLEETATNLEETDFKVSEKDKNSSENEILEEYKVKQEADTKEMKESCCDSKIPKERDSLSVNIIIKAEEQRQEDKGTLEDEKEEAIVSTWEQQQKEDSNKNVVADEEMPIGRSDIKMEDISCDSDRTELVKPKLEINEENVEEIDITERPSSTTNTRPSIVDFDVVERTPKGSKQKPIIPIHNIDFVEVSPQHRLEVLRRSATLRKRSASCDQPSVMVRSGRQRLGSVDVEMPSTSSEATPSQRTRASSKAKEPQKRTRRAASAAELISDVTELAKTPVRRSKRTASVTANLPAISEETSTSTKATRQTAIKDNAVKEEKVATPTRSSTRRRSLAKTDSMEEKTEEKEVTSSITTRGRRKKLEQQKEEPSEQESSPSSTTEGSISGRLRARRPSAGSTSSVDSMASRRRRSTSIEDTAPATPKKTKKLSQISEEPEKESEEPKKKRGRQRKGSAT